MRALDAGDPRDRAALGALTDDELARRLEEAVLVDRVRRRVLARRPRVPSNTQSVETSTTCAAAALAASTTWRVAPTYAAHAARRSAAIAAGSLRIAACTMASGAVARTARSVAAPSVRSRAACDGATTSAPRAREHVREVRPDEPRRP